MTQADGELDTAKRAQLYQQAQDMLVGGSPVAFMWNNVNAYLVKPWVSGIQETPMDADFTGAMVPLSIALSQPAP